MKWLKDSEEKLKIKEKSTKITYMPWKHNEFRNKTKLKKEGKYFKINIDTDEDEDEDEKKEDKTDYRMGCFGRLRARSKNGGIFSFFVNLFKN